MTNRSLIILTGALLSLSGCFDPTKDTGAIDTAGSAEGGGGQDGQAADDGGQDDGGQDGKAADDGGDEGGASAATESCDWTGIGLCFELDSYDNTEDWCAEMSATYDIATRYREGPCSSGEVGTCAIPYASGSDFPVDVTAYYYSAFPGDPMDSCVDAGGTWE